MGYLFNDTLFLEDIYKIKWIRVTTEILVKTGHRHTFISKYYLFIDAASHR